MIRILIAICFFYTCGAIIAQGKGEQAVNGYFAFGVHGSGDISGFQYGLQYSQLFSKKFSWFLEFGGSLHDASDDELIFQDEEGNTFDGTLHFVIGGLQIGGGLHYHLFNANKHSLSFTIMPLVRYQATSISDYIQTVSGLENIPIPVRVLYRLEPARTIALGGAFRLNYGIALSKSYAVGLGAGFQTDTNGDAISSLFLNVSKKF